MKNSKKLTTIVRNILIGLGLLIVALAITGVFDKKKVDPYEKFEKTTVVLGEIDFYRDSVLAYKGKIDANWDIIGFANDSIAQELGNTKKIESEIKVWENEITNYENKIRKFKQIIINDSIAVKSYKKKIK